MSQAVRRRFWDRADVVAGADVAAAADGFALRLDARPLRLPGGAVLRCRSRKLAEALAAEWNLAGGSKGGVFGDDGLVLTALAGTMQQYVAPSPAAAVAGLLRFAGADLLCYRATGPDSLVALQVAQWQPWLDWIEREHGIELIVTQGVMPVTQPQAALAGLRHLLEGLSAGTLTGLGVVVPALGSLVLGLALASSCLDAAEAARLARLDEDFQARHWGSDGVCDAQAAGLRAEIAMAARFMVLAAG